jgi:small nuclear ribonucleoprotein (snRNP)-like protein
MNKYMSGINSHPINRLRKEHNNFIGIRLKDGREFRGYLDAQDQHMNMVLRNAIEYYKGDKVASFGKIFIRGNNILWVQIELTPE